MEREQNQELEEFLRARSGSHGVDKGRVATKKYFVWKYHYGIFGTLFVDLKHKSAIEKKLFDVHLMTGWWAPPCQWDVDERAPFLSQVHLSSISCSPLLSSPFLSSPPLSACVYVCVCVEGTLSLSLKDSTRVYPQVGKAKIDLYLSGDITCIPQSPALPQFRYLAPHISFHDSIPFGYNEGHQSTSTVCLRWEETSSALAFHLCTNHTKLDRRLCFLLLPRPRSDIPFAVGRIISTSPPF